MDYFRELGYEYIRDPSIAADSKSPERVDYGEVMLSRRLHDALARLNSGGRSR